MSSFSLSSERQFGFLIAYLIPGFVVLNGLGKVSPMIAGWLAVSHCEPALGGFLYSMLASLFAGLFCSTLRWLLVDSVHTRTGIKLRHWQMEQLARNFEAFEIIVAYHYRYYQFYGSMLIAIPIWLGLSYRTLSGENAAILIAIALLLEFIFFLGSRDSFRKYVTRSNELLESKLKIIW